MNINNKDFSTFNTNVVSFSPTSIEVNNNIELMEGSLTPILGKQLLNTSQRVLVLDFNSVEDMDKFINEISSFSIIDFDDGYSYKCYLNGTPSITEDGYNAYTMSCSMYVIKQKEMQTVGTKFVNLGTTIAEAIYEINSVDEKTNVQIGDYKIKVLKGNDTLIVDGIDKLVYYDSDPNTSVIDDVEMYSFPKIEKGQNNIEVSEGVEVVIKYYPTFSC